MAQALHCADGGNKPLSVCDLIIAHHMREKALFDERFFGNLAKRSSIGSEHKQELLSKASESRIVAERFQNLDPVSILDLVSTVVFMLDRPNPNFTERDHHLLEALQGRFNTLNEFFGAKCKKTRFGKAPVDQRSFKGVYRKTEFRDFFHSTLCAAEITYHLGLYKIWNVESKPDILTYGDYRKENVARMQKLLRFMETNGNTLSMWANLPQHSR